ncbi:hypothetical protein ACFX2B_001698 [Malus domestica]
MLSEGEGGGGHMIKLFGKTIPLAITSLNRESSSAIDEPCGSVDHDVAATACGGDESDAEDCSETRQKLSSYSSRSAKS